MAGLMDWLSGNAGAASPSSGGLMGTLADPNKAAALGFFNGLLQASGPSRIPINLGQEISGGMQGATQGFGNSLGMQQQLLRMRALQGLMGGADQSAGGQAPQGAAPSMSALGGPNSMMPATMGTSGSGGTPDGSSASGAPAPQGAAGTSIFGRTPQQLWQQGMLMNMAGIQGGADMMKMAAQYDPQLQYALPTDSQRDVAAAYGQGTPQAQQALQGIVNKNGSMTGRAGGYVIGPQGITWLPNVEQGGMPVIQNGVPTGAVTAQPGATDIASSMAAAKAGGKAKYQLQQVWDPTANNGAGGFVQQTTANVANAANGGNVPLGIQNNNFGNIRSADGNGFASYNTAQDGVNAADNLLSTYGSKYGINTINGIANRWSPAGDGNNNPAAKAAAMAAASGVPANQPINLADPATRARILPALFDTETPGWRNAIGGAQPQRGGPMASQPPVGYTTATNTSQGAPSEQMKTSYGAMSTADSAYQQSREALTGMIGLAGNKGAGGAVVGVLPEGIGTKISPDAAEYQKLHATYVALQGKALGSGGTDASRATIDEAVPTYDKPQTAMVSGLNTQLNNLDMAHMKTQFLTPTYQQGNEKQYTQLSAAFDQNIKPQMMPVLQLQGDQQRAAVQAAVKANPALRSSYEWAFNNGLLK